MIPIIHPCSYPLHVRHKLEPYWITEDIDYPAWCKQCKAKQARRSKDAAEKKYVKRVNWKRVRLNPLVTNGNSSNPWMRVNNWSPPGMRWCCWGLHFHKEAVAKHAFCKDCSTAAYKERRARALKPQLLIRKPELQREVTALEQQKMALKKEIREYQRMLAKMRVVTDDLEDKGIEGSSRLVVLPVQPLKPPPPNNVARSYT